jgi:DNA-binding NarL/FixJ family response regulator
MGRDARLGSAAPVRVLLADDQPLFSRGLADAFGRDPRFVLSGQAETAQEAIELVRLQRPQVLLSGFLEGSASTAVLRALRTAAPRTAVLVLARDADPDSMRQAICAGAGGYLLRDSTAETILDAAAALAAGTSVLDPRVTPFVFDTIRQQRRSEVNPEGLSRQEQRVLPLIAAGKSNREIGAALDISPETVKTYVRGVMRKLNFSRRSQIAAYFASGDARRTEPPAG